MPARTEKIRIRFYFYVWWINMKCMYCGFTESKVIDSRASEDGTSIRRRRECLRCGRRFTTYETVETTPVLVIKNDGTRQPFDASKIRNGIIKSCEKRPVALHDIDRLVSDIEKKSIQHTRSRDSVRTYRRVRNGRTQNDRSGCVYKVCFGISAVSGRN